MFAVLAAVDEAIAAEDWDQLKTARQAVDQAMHDTHGLLIGTTLYRHRQAGTDIDAEIARARDEDTRAADARRAQRDQPKSRKPRKPEPPT